MSNDILTVDSLKELLDKLSIHGHGDMQIFLGTDTPLLKPSISFNCSENKMWIHNSYYDREMADAARELSDTVSDAVSKYISKCYDTGFNIKPDNAKDAKDPVIQEYLNRIAAGGDTYPSDIHVE